MTLIYERDLDRYCEWRRACLQNEVSRPKLSEV